MESYIKLSTLNDFIYCPKSIFYHSLYENYDKNIYQESAQKQWLALHKSIDSQKYSSSKHILQWLSVYSQYYQIAGKIDTFNVKTGELIERKTEIYLDENWNEKIYLWQKYQLWWQMFCLQEMWYEVQSIYIYSKKTNKKYRIYKPSWKQIIEFENILNKYKKFDLFQKYWKQNPKKCHKCIYRELCDYYIWEIYPQLPLFK